MIIAKQPDLPLTKDDVKKNCDIKLGLSYSFTYTQDGKIGFVQCKNYRDFLYHIKWLSDEKIGALISIRKHRIGDNLYPRYLNDNVTYCLDVATVKEENETVGLLDEIAKLSIDITKNKGIMWAIEKKLDNFDVLMFMDAAGEFKCVNNYSKYIYTGNTYCEWGTYGFESKYQYRTKDGVKPPGPLTSARQSHGLVHGSHDDMSLREYIWGI